MKDEILNELSKTDDKWFAYEEYSYNTGAFDEFISVFKSFNEYSSSHVLRQVIYELLDDGGLHGKNKNKIQFFWNLISCNLQPENCLPKQEPKMVYDPNQTRVTISDEQERERQEIIDAAIKPQLKKSRFPPVPGATRSGGRKRNKKTRKSKKKTN